MLKPLQDDTCGTARRRDVVEMNGSTTDIIRPFTPKDLKANYAEDAKHLEDKKSAGRKNTPFLGKDSCRSPWW